MNPQIDSDCMNLWAGSEYCVQRASTSTSAPVAGSTETIKAVKIAVIKTSTSLKASTSSFVSSASAPSASATEDDSEEDEDDDEDGDCEADDEYED
ncbi:hypothetical protein P7C70_g9631, partial [Phenoliferia sp. Uapishka_3]